jgi:hypothetical protein
MAARESGLTSVVFISDACRSIPNNLQSSRLDGNSIFPNRQLNRRTRPEVDRLFATLPSLVAVEAAKADDNARREGVFTREFMLSYRDPPAALIEQRMEAGQSFEIVTNRKLKDLVRTLVEDAAFAAAPQSAQLPEFILESVDAYVGRVESAQSQTGQMPRLPLPDIGTSLGKEIKELRGGSRASIFRGRIGRPQRRSRHAGYRPHPLALLPRGPSMSPRMPARSRRRQLRRQELIDRSVSRPR